MVRVRAYERYALTRVASKRTTESKGNVRLLLGEYTSMNRRNLFVFAASFALTACIANPEMEESDENIGSAESGLVVKSAFYGGSTVTLGTGNDNAAWYVNMSDQGGGTRTSLAATITHGGLLNGLFGLDHLAIGIRGLSVEGAFQQMGLPLQTGTFLYGEQVQQAVSAGIVSQSNLKALASGRGITFWPKGQPYCKDSTRPCAIFENYTTNFTADGLVCANGRNKCSGAVAVDLTSGSFQVYLGADHWDTWVDVVQNGISRASISCRTISRTAALPNGDSRCGYQTGDAAFCDAFIGNVIPGTGNAIGRTVGATNINVAVHRDVE